MEDHDRVRSAARAAARDKASSPYRKEDRNVRRSWASAIAISLFEVIVGVHLTGDPTAPWWMVWGWWIVLAVSLLSLVIFKPFVSRIRRRNDLLAREQVFQVRRLDPAADPVGFGMGALHDAYQHPSLPGQPLDRESALAGAIFAIAQVHETIDEIDRATPKGKLFGTEMPDVTPKEWKR